MESVSNRRQQEEIRQAEIRKQIASLQAQLVDVSNTSGIIIPERPCSPKRKKPDGPILAPSTPSPKRRRLDNSPRVHSTSKSRPLPSLTARISNARRQPSGGPKSAPSIPKPAPSTVLTKLASFAPNVDPAAAKQISNRSSGFSERPAPLPAEHDDDVAPEAAKRDERLTLIEDLEIGPTEHKPPFDDPIFERLEPNSGIRLSSRTLPHDDLQDYLRGRYYLSPSKLYSVVRLQPNKQGYDVPVEGDWVTIAVIAERGQLKYSKAPVGIGKDGQEEIEEKEDTLDDIALDGTSNTVKTDLRKWKGKAKEQQAAQKPSGKRYINLKLIDFGCRSSSSSTAGKSVIRGDALLSLLLFESDRVETAVDGDGKKQQIYHGGSRGAFERMSKLKEGAVVALLNPRILKPFQHSTDQPHPTNNILALTPESVDSTVVIGQSLDLGMCKAIKRDGKVCGSWCDKRVSDVCDWHITNAIKRNRAARPEFSIGTSGLSTAPKRTKPQFDPKRQWGLLPDETSSGGGSTYIVSGHIISNRPDTRSMYVGEAVGREAQAKAARAHAKDADRALQKLLRKDKEGMKYLMTAREHAKRKMDEDGASDKASTPLPKKLKSKGKGEAKQTEQSSEESDSSQSCSTSDEDSKASGKQAKSYSAHLIRNLGFDPTGKEGRKVKHTDVQKKLDALAALQASRREVDLGPRPGKKASQVRPPTNAESLSGKQGGTQTVVCLDSDSEDDLRQCEATAFGRTKQSTADAKMVDLDSSDVE